MCHVWRHISYSWVCVYPTYIDADKSVADGRKIAKNKAVKDPHAYHMAVAVQMLGLSVVYETKRHPRDWTNPGRVKVKLFDDNHRPMISNIRNRKISIWSIAMIWTLIMILYRQRTICCDCRTCASIAKVAWKAQECCHTHHILGRSGSYCGWTTKSTGSAYTRWNASTESHAQYACQAQEAEG